MGPIGMLVIQRTLSKGRWPAFFTGIGAAVSDLIYCLLTGFCLSFVTGFIETHNLIIQIIGAVVLIGFGIYLLKKHPTRALKTADVQNDSFWSEFASGFQLTFSNPLILFFIIGLFARFNFILPEFLGCHYVVAFICIFLGAILWWYAITLFVNKLRKRINLRSLKLINRIIGILLLVMALGGLLLAFYPTSATW